MEPCWIKTKCTEIETGRAGYKTKKSAKRKTNLKIVAYERDEKRMSMKMNRIMG